MRFMAVAEYDDRYPNYSKCYLDYEYKLLPSVPVAVMRSVKATLPYHAIP